MGSTNKPSAAGTGIGVQVGSGAGVGEGTAVDAGGTSVGNTGTAVGKSAEVGGGVPQAATSASVTAIQATRTVQTGKPCAVDNLLDNFMGRILSIVSQQAQCEKSAGHDVMTGTQNHRYHACAQAWHPAYFSTPVTTTPWMKTRWARKNRSTGNAMAIRAAA